LKDSHILVTHVLIRFLLLVHLNNNLDLNYITKYPISSLKEKRYCMNKNICCKAWIDKFTFRIIIL